MVSGCFKMFHGIVGAFRTLQVGFRENIELSDKYEVSNGFQGTSRSFKRFKKILMISVGLLGHFRSFQGDSGVFYYFF